MKIISKVILAVLILGPFKDIARADGSLCPPIWDEYIQVIGKISTLESNDRPILFSDRQGVVYNCLDQEISNEVISFVEAIQASLPYNRKSILQNDASLWPPNICRVSEISVGDSQLLVVNLPVDEHILHQSACRNAIEGSIILTGKGK